MPVSRRVYRVAPKARHDLEAIWLYSIETWSSEQADAYYRGLIDCFADLAANTKHGRQVDGIRSGYKVLAFLSHFIIYKETGRLVTVIRILHRRMNITNHL